jgi:hypothetical protein
MIKQEKIFSRAQVFLREQYRFCRKNEILFKIQFTVVCGVSAGKDTGKNRAKTQFVIWIGSIGSKPVLTVSTLVEKILSGSRFRCDYTLLLSIICINFAGITINPKI